MTNSPNPSGNGESQTPEFRPGIDDTVFFNHLSHVESRAESADSHQQIHREQPKRPPSAQSKRKASKQRTARPREPEPQPKLLTGLRDAITNTGAGVSERYSASAAIPICVFAIVAALALMPMFLTHLGHLSRMPHRSHYVIVLLGFAVLVWRRWAKATSEPQIALRPLDVAILVGSCVLFAIATRLGSPWLATASLVFLAGVFLRRLPSVDGIGYGGPWAFLLLLLPLPLGFDQSLIGSLQVFATTCSSRLLDLMTVNHMVSGNVLELPGRQLFIDEACSGIQSLFAMLTCVAFFVVWTKRPVILAIPLLLSSVVMCTITNIFRIVLVVQAELRGVDLATGWPHECLGVTLFALALGLVYCSEGFFLFLFAPIINPATGTPDNRSARFWNNLTKSIHTAVYGVLPTGQETTESTWLDRFLHPQAIAKACVLTATLCFAFFGVTQHIHGHDSAREEEMSGLEHAMLQQSEALREDSLPEAMGPWRRVSFERIDRNGGLITDSVAWTYRSPFYEATLSLDYPFYGSHNVSECYHLTGWDVREKTTTPLGYSKATLSRPFGEHALLFYDVFDAEGTVELESVRGKLTERLEDLNDRSKRPTWQLQLIIQSDFGLTRSDLNETELAFRDLRNQLRQIVTGKPATASSGGAQ